MEIEKFTNFIKSGFDVSFNYKEVFYTISLIDLKDGIKYYGIGSNNGFLYDFDSLESILNFVLCDKKIADIINEISEDEVYY